MNKLGISGKTVIAVVAALAGLVTWSAGPARAQQPAKPMGPVAMSWDINNDGTYDLVGFATTVSNDQLIIDGITLPSALTGRPTPVRLGNGHGRFRYRPQDRSLLVRTFHAEVYEDNRRCIYPMCGGFYVITGRLIHTSGARFEGKATIEQFASLDAFRAGMPPVWSSAVMYEWDFDYYPGIG